MTFSNLPFSQKELSDLLSPIKTPQNLSLTENGKIESCSLKDGKLLLTIAISRQHAKELSQLCTKASQELLKLPQVKHADIVLTAHKVATDPAQAKQPPKPQLPPTLQGTKHIIAVASGKGGVGKSTSSVNIAAGLTSLGLKVALLDADISGPSIHHMLGVTSKPFVKDGKLLPVEAWGMKAMSIGMLIPDREALIWRGPMVIQAINQLLSDVAWGENDVMIVDLPPGTGDIPLSLAQKTPLTGAIIVSTPQDIALIDAQRSVTMFQKLRTPILGIVENMAYFQCPHCEEKTYLFDQDGARKEAEKLDVPFLGDVPLIPEIRSCADSGVPIVTGAPGSPGAQAWLAVAQKVKSLLK